MICARSSASNTGSMPICATTPLVWARVSGVRSGTFSLIFSIRPCAMASRMTSFEISAQITAVLGCQSISSHSSRMMDRVHSVWMRAPDPPAEPITSGMSSSRAPCISSRRSFFAAIRLTMATPAPSLCGPASVDPASTTMASGFSASARWNDSWGNPYPRMPQGEQIQVRIDAPRFLRCTRHVCHF